MPNVEHFGENPWIEKENHQFMCSVSREASSQGIFLNPRVYDEGSIGNVEKLVLNLLHCLEFFSQERC